MDADLLARVGEKVGPVSIFVNAFGMNAMLLEAIAELVRRRIEPSVSRSSNSPGGDDANVAVMGRDKPRDL